MLAPGVIKNRIIIITLQMTDKVSKKDHFVSVSPVLRYNR